jgi:hypothetical protein
MASGMRPSDEHYWRRPWSSMLFAGDLFEAIPFGTQPTVAVEADDEDGAHKHYVGAIEFAYGLLLSPTCDMTDQKTGASAHPYRVLVPVVSFEAVCDALEMPNDRRGLLRSRDQLRPYLYLPAVPGTDEGELIALLFRPTTVSEEFLRTPPRRLAQLHPLARRHIKVKLAAYWARAGVDPNALAIFERDEERPRDGDWPPSPYDPPDPEFADRLPAPDWDPEDRSSGLAPPVA